MLETRSYHSVKLDIAKSNPGKVVYLIFPEGLTNETRKWIEPAAKAHGCSIAVISEINWNDSLTPWEAAGVFKKEKPFGGKADLFLRSLAQDLIPSIEASIGAKAPERILAGISLSGLFAIWTSFKSSLFQSIISISGSLWYDGFSEWVKGQDSPYAKNFYLSLGNREKKTRDHRLSNVEEATCSIAGSLRIKGCEVMFDLCEGTHFSPALPRVDKAIAYFMESNLLTNR